MTLATAQESTAVDKLKASKLIPDVIENTSFQPSTDLQIKYTSSGQSVDYGNLLTVSGTSEQPLVKFRVPDASQFYTLVMTDPDAPSAINPIYGPWRHWIVTNIDGENPEMSIQSPDNQLSPYVGPGPPPNSGDHRYIFLLYQQATRQAFQPMQNERNERRNFDIRTFEKINHLELISANFFLCSAESGDSTNA
ncbi:phosphatidylethanolamine-binding protein [Blakeslea trispora]|nr:phosphatidylethanolamine-binding protein [Blakeslea trispora]